VGLFVRVVPALPYVDPRYSVGRYAVSINRPDPGETDEQFKARRAAWMKAWKAKRPKKARSPRLHTYRPSEPARMVLSPWTVERNGVMSRELRGT
jgi:hypothetical protein